MLTSLRYISEIPNYPAAGIRYPASGIQMSDVRSQRTRLRSASYAAARTGQKKDSVASELQTDWTQAGVH